MTLEKLEARQQKEIADYLREREKRHEALEKDQWELVNLCIGTGQKAHDMLKNLLNEQRQAWEAMERDELDMLQHIHTLEQGSFLDKQAKREELAALLSKGKEKDKDHGR
jgi:hypothetical protein